MAFANAPLKSTAFVFAPKECIWKWPVNKKACKTAIVLYGTEVASE